MRYLTQQWYQTMQDSGLGVCLVVDDRAAEYSEALFQELWKEKLEQWLKEQEEVCELLGEPLDEERERRSFEQNQERVLTQFRTRTPERILSHVADPRLLALGYSTAEVRKAFADFSEQCRQHTDQIWKQYWAERRAAGLDEAFTGEHSLHDSVVLTTEREGEDLVIEFERDEVEWPEIRAVRFRDARILVRERPIENAWWLYDEIWQTDEGGYEIHVLLWDGEPFALSVECIDTELVWTREPTQC